MKPRMWQHSQPLHPAFIGRFTLLVRRSIRKGELPRWTMFTYWATFRLRNLLVGMHAPPFMRYRHVMNPLGCRYWKQRCQDVRWYWEIFPVCGKFGVMQ